MSEPLENLYFNWLCARVVNINESSPGLTYWILFGALHRTEFVWLPMGDENRAYDGKDLRTDFLLQADIPDNPEWRELECSLLEMFIAFSRRAETMMSDMNARQWFWEFMENLGLKEQNDANADLHQIAEIVDVFLWRTYNPDGSGGGMLPLKVTRFDQRKIELWDQFCDYLIDQDRLP